MIGLRPGSDSSKECWIKCRVHDCDQSHWLKIVSSIQCHEDTCVIKHCHCVMDVCHWCHQSVTMSIILHYRQKDDCLLTMIRVSEATVGGTSNVTLTMTPTLCQSPRCSVIMPLDASVHYKCHCLLFDIFDLGHMFLWTHIHLQLSRTSTSSWNRRMV